MVSASSTVLTGLLTTVATSALQTALAKRAMKDQREPGIKTEHTTSGGTEAQSFVIRAGYANGWPYGLPADVAQAGEVSRHRTPF